MASSTDVHWLFQQAAQGLRPGELIISDHLDLLRAMNAIEIGHPQVDTGCITQEQKQQPPFDPSKSLGWQDVLAVMDGLWEREMTWHDGQDLSQTIFTCLYVLELDAIDPLAFPSSDPQLRPLVCLVLRAYVIGLLKTCDMAVEEFRKNHLVEGEDFSTETNGVSLLEETSIDDVIILLDEAQGWLDSQDLSGQDQGWKAAIGERLSFRRAFLIALCVLSATPADQDTKMATPHLEIAQLAFSLQDGLPRAGAAAQERIHKLGIFDPFVARRLPTLHPPRPLSVMDWQEARKTTQEILTGMEAAARMSKLQSWSEIYSFFYFQGRQDAPAILPNKEQTSFCVADKILRTRPLSWLAHTFLQDTVGIPPTALQPSSRLADPLQHFLNKLGGQLHNYVTISAQNGARRKRKLLLSLANWQDLSSDVVRLTTDIDPVHQQQILSAITALELGIALQAFSSGFRLDLYARDEVPAVYWVCGMLLSQLLALLDEGSAAWRGIWQTELELCRALSLMAELFLPATIALPVDKEQARFERRFSKIPKGLLPELSWDKWRKRCREVATSREEQIKQARRHLDRATEECNALVNSPALRESGQEQLTEVIAMLALCIRGNVTRLTTPGVKCTAAWQDWFLVLKS